MTDRTARLVAYERVSTARQGRSGLGLDAQRKAIDDYACARHATVLGRFTEIESGSRNDRPELDKALILARLTGATLVIAKLDRLSRDAAFLLTLQASGARLLACDMPQANDLTVGIMALVAQQEREAISRRTREALAAAKAREARQPQRSRGAQTCWAGCYGAAEDGGAQRRRLRRRTCPRHCGNPRGRPHHPARHRRQAQRPSHPHATRTAVACVKRAKSVAAVGAVGIDISR